MTPDDFYLGTRTNYELEEVYVDCPRCSWDWQWYCPTFREVRQTIEAHIAEAHPD